MGLLNRCLALNDFQKHFAPFSGISCCTENIETMPGPKPAILIFDLRFWIGELVNGTQKATEFRTRLARERRGPRATDSK